MKVGDLRAKAVELGLDATGVRKGDLVDMIFSSAAEAEGFKSVSGILEIGSEGYGWIRTGNYMEGDNDAFVHQQIIKGYGLRSGDAVAGTVGPGRSGTKYPPLQTVIEVNGREPGAIIASILDSVAVPQVTEAEMGGDKGTGDLSLSG